MIIIYLALSILSGVLLTLPAQAEEEPPETGNGSSVLQSAFGEPKKRVTERDERITTFVLNVAKGIAIVIALLVLRAVIKAVGCGVEEEGTEGPFIVFITTASEEEAATIGRTLVEEHLAVSSNITPQIRSIYRWQDNIEDGPEFLMVVKTVQGHIPAIVSRVSELHSYDVPDIIALPIRRVQDPLKDWIVETPTKKTWWKRS